jgi:hypothetical protein
MVKRIPSTMEQRDLEQQLYRRLFLKRYAMLIDKVEKTYGLSPEDVAQLKKRVLCLDWADVGVQRLSQKLASK